MRFVPVFLAVAVFTAIASLVPQAFAEDEGGEAEGAATFSVHEWGVWRVDRGRVIDMQALADECPDFVQRTPAATPRSPRVRSIPTIRQSPVSVEKPVVFFHTDAPIENVEVRVSFRRGTPWLVWPAARVQGRTVRWTGRLIPRTSARPLAPARRGDTLQMHPWWGHLRSAHGARFEPADGSVGEDFLFYDGAMPFRSPFRFRLRGTQPASVSARGAERVAYVASGGVLRRHELPARGQTRVSELGPTATSLAPALRADLVALGLTELEASSLLLTWRDELTDSRGPRAFYLLTPASYDRMLALRISPRPQEIKRAGLIIESIRGE